MHTKDENSIRHQNLLPKILFSSDVADVVTVGHNHINNNNNNNNNNMRANAVEFVPETVIARPAKGAITPKRRKRALSDSSSYSKRLKQSGMAITIPNSPTTQVVSIISPKACNTPSREMPKRTTMEELNRTIISNQKMNACPMQVNKIYDEKLESVSDYVNKGIEMASNRKLDDAIINFSKALELDPNNMLIWFNRALAYMQMCKYDKALYDLNNAINGGCNDAIAFFSRGVCYLSNHMYKEAVLDFSKSIELDPKDMESLMNRGLAYTNLGCLVEALRDYTKLIEMDPNNAQAYHHRSIVYLYKRQYMEALKDAELAYTKEIGNIGYRTRYFSLKEAIEEGIIGIFH
jgi:tetratricopeptide (TPR) repeat protein